MRKNLSQNAKRDDFCSVSTKACRAGGLQSLLWRAFPGKSEREVAQLGAPVLDVSERQIINCCAATMMQRCPTSLQ